MADLPVDIAADLRDRFEFAIIWFCERSEVMSDGKTDPDLSDDDAKAVELVKALLDTVDTIPPPLSFRRQSVARLDLLDRTGAVVTYGPR
jgi:hypothetical protein